MKMFRLRFWQHVSSLLSSLAVMGMGMAWLSCAQAQASNQRSISVDDPRPVAKALEKLTSDFPGTVVTYEDPPYAYAGDIKDVTLEVRRDLHLYAPGKAPKVLIPMGGTLAAEYAVSNDTGSPADWMATLQNVVGAQASKAVGGRFRVEQNGEAFHVVPAQVRNGNGEWVQAKSVLDTRITIPERELSGLEMIEEFTAALTEATGIHVELGTVPINLLMHHHGTLKASNEVARDVLVSALEGTQAKLRWQLFYGPDVKSYSLNLGIVALPPGPVLPTITVPQGEPSPAAVVGPFEGRPDPSVPFLRGPPPENQ